MKIESGFSLAMASQPFGRNEVLEKMIHEKPQINACLLRKSNMTVNKRNIQRLSNNKL